jgi:glycolate oxidase FAD binding subunit
MTPPAKLEDLVSPAQISVREGKPILSPNKTEEISAIARYANQHNLAIEITGAGTKRSWGNPATADLLLNTTHLTGVLSHSWQDLTTTVAAGTPWSAMQKVLAQHNQQVALDPLWPETATVGGIIATNDSGALRLKYGSLRDLIIGMTIVLADGTIAKSGGKVVKNVAGYDLHKLMTGAFGTLGIIAEVTFRLHPIPAHAATWTISSPRAEPVGELMMKVLDSQLTPQAMQLRAGPEGYSLDVELASLPKVLAQQVASLDQLASTIPGLAAAQSINPFAAREQLFADAGGVLVKITVLPSDIATLSALVVGFAGSAVTQATGITYARFPENVEDDTLQALGAFVHLAEVGSITILHGPQPVIKEWRGGRPLPIMREIKHQFDPNRILNPGRFLGGI